MIFVGAKSHDIEKGIQKASSNAFRSTFVNMRNPYGDGYSSERAYSLIKSVDFKSMLAKKEDPLDDKS